MVAKEGSGSVILVDDVVTSGASILEGRRALIAAGFEVVGFITIAETLLEKSKKTSKVRAGEPEWV
jgi:orotate phosphoribosyltransferase